MVSILNLIYREFLNSAVGTPRWKAMTVDVITTLLALLSLSVFGAHALDAYRSAASAGQKLRAR
jgi:hypothetical protein